MSYKYSKWRCNGTYNKDSEEDDSWKYPEVKNLVTPSLENEDSWLDADASA